MKRHIPTVLAILVAGLLSASVAGAAESQGSRFAIGFHTTDAPIGVRWWVRDAVGLDFAVGYSSQKNPGGVDPNLTLNGYTAEFGVPIAIMTWERASLLARPGIEYSKQDDYDIDFFTDETVRFKTTHITALAELEAEIFLAPRVSVSASQGFSFQYFKTDQLDSVSETLFGLSGSNFSEVGFHVYLGH